MGALKNAVAGAKQEHEIVMVLNFFDELRHKVPAGKSSPGGLPRDSRREPRIAIDEARF